MDNAPLDLDEDRSDDEHEGEAINEDNDDDNGNDETNEFDDNEFVDQCKGIEANNKGYTECLIRRVLDNNRARTLGKSLMGNTYLHELKVYLSVDLTVPSALSLVGGLVRSQVKILALGGDHGIPPSLDVMEQIYNLPLQQKFSCLETLHICFDLRRDEHAELLGRSLTGNQWLQNLSLDVRHVSPAGAQAIAEGIRSSLIKNLALDDDGTLYSEYATLTETMEILYEHAVHGSPRMRCLSVSGTCGGLDVLLNAKTPANSPSVSLCKLEIKWCSLSLVNAQLLNNALMLTAASSSALTQLEVLNLWWCDLGEEHMRILSYGLGNHKSLQHLLLMYNEMGDAGIALFINNWSHESVIRILDLTASRISGVGAKRLLEALPNHASMDELVLNSNFAMSYDGLKLIGETLVGKRLITLGLDGVAHWFTYHDASEDAIRQASKATEAGKALVEGMRRNMYVKSMSIAVHGFDWPTRVKDELELYLSANKRGRSLLLEHHNLPLAFWCYWIEKQGDDSSLIYLFLRELPMLISAGRK